MLLSSCVVWRHRDWEAFRDECPQGDEALQRLVWERFDDAMAWLVARGAPARLGRDRGTRGRIGKRFDPRGLVDALAGEDRPSRRRRKRWSTALFILHGRVRRIPAKLVTRFVRPAASLRLRANPWSAGDGLEATGSNAARELSGGMDEFYGRNMPDATVGRDGACVAVAALRTVCAHFRRGRHRVLLRATRCRGRRRMWSLTTARRPGARAYYVLDDAALRRRVRDRTVGGHGRGGAGGVSRHSSPTCRSSPRKARCRRCE